MKGNIIMGLWCLLLAAVLVWLLLGAIERGGKS